MTTQRQPVEQRTTTRRQISERRLKLRGTSLLSAENDDRRTVDRRGIAKSMADALDDILHWESRESA